MESQSKIKDGTVNNLSGTFDSEVADSKRKFYVNEEKFPYVFQMEEASMILVRKFKDYHVEGKSIVFITEGHFYKKRYSYRYLDARPFYDKKPGARDICVKLTLCTDDIIRLQAAEGRTVPENRTEMVVNDFTDAVDFSISEDENCLYVFTKTLNIKVEKNPWNISIADKSGKVFYKQFTEETRSFVKFENCPFGFLIDNTTNEKYACESICFKDTEHFYGFGEKFTLLDKKGQNINLWNRDARSVYTERSWKNIPFFMSTAGYGIFMNSSRKINCNMGQQYYKSYSIMAGGENIDYYIIYGPSIKEILPRYTDITGKTPMPPKWSFGFWISKMSYETQQEVEGVADRFRNEQIPCDVIHIDTNWFDEDWVCNWKFGKKRFPDLKAMFEKMNQMGYKITLWQLPYVEKGSAEYDVYDEGMEKGYFAFKPDGTMEFPHALIDLSNPEAVDWYKQKLLKPLLEMGISGIKVDFGEAIPPFYRYSKYCGEDMHNLYPLLYNKAAFEVTEEVKGEGQGIIWARSTWAGSQRYPIHWGGDSGTDFNALTASIKGGLSFGLSGFPFWSHDIGGFFFETNPELYVRWAQVGFFTSHSRAHGFYTREPWDFGEEAKNIFKKYAELRYKLIPYIYSSAMKCCSMSLPMFRALVVDYQDDPGVYNIDSQYLFCDDFLVAPILDECNERDIYLPEGIWTDYWDKKQYEGRKWIKYEAPLDKLPLFIKQNAIIPMGPVMNYVDEKEYDPITLDLYPVNGVSNFYLADGDGVIKIDMSSDKGRMAVMISRCTHNFEVRINNASPKGQVMLNGEKCNSCIEGDAYIIKCSLKDSEASIEIL